MSQTLKNRIQEDMKTALRARDSRRLGVIRMILAAIKQREVDERTELDDAQVIATLGRLIKQRRDAIGQYQKAQRQDLVDKEAYEIGVIEAYLPPALTDEQIDRLIDEAIAATGAQSVKDMGKVMGVLKPRIQGRADMGAVSARVRARLS